MTHYPSRRRAPALASSAAALAFGCAFAAPAGAQTPPAAPQGVTPAEIEELRLQQDFEDHVARWFRQADAHRLGGRCEARADNLRNVRQALGFNRHRMSPPDHDRVQRQLEAATALPCGSGEAGGQPPRVVVEGRLGTGETEIPSTGGGFVRTDSSSTAGERPAILGKTRLTTRSVEASVGTPRLGRFSLGYREGDASHAATIPVLGSGGQSGVVGTAEAPSGSTGVAANLGLSATAEAAFEEIVGSYEYAFGVPDRLNGRGSRISLFGSLTALSRDRDHATDVAIAGTTGGGFEVRVDQALDQGVTEREFGAGLEARTVVPIARGTRLTFSARAGAYVYDWDMSSLETRTQNVGPASDQAYTVRIEDQDSGLGYQGGVRVELGFDVGRAAQLLFAAEGSYRSDRARIVNPSSGDFVLAGGETFLDSEGAGEWRATAAVRVALGEVTPSWARTPLRPAGPR